jgi:hypothetical protein
MVRVAPQSLVFCVVFCGSLFIILTYYFGLSISLSLWEASLAFNANFNFATDIF